MASREWPSFEFEFVFQCKVHTKSLFLAFLNKWPPNTRLKDEGLCVCARGACAHDLSFIFINLSFFNSLHPSGVQCWHKHTVRLNKLANNSCTFWTVEMFNYKPPQIFHIYLKWFSGKICRLLTVVLTHNTALKLSMGNMSFLTCKQQACFICKYLYFSSNFPVTFILSGTATTLISSGMTHRLGILSTPKPKMEITKRTGHCQIQRSRQKTIIQQSFTPWWTY